MTYSCPKKTRIINGFEVPEQVREELEKGQEYCIPNLSASHMVTNSSWKGDEVDLMRLERGLIHLDEESAIANAKAMCKIDHCADDK